MTENRGRKLPPGGAAAQLRKAFLEQRGLPTEGALEATEDEATPTEAASSEATTPTAGTSSTSEDATPRIVAAANAFLATLSDTEKAKVLGENVRRVFGR